MDRPHIVYNAATGQYVCWLKIMGEGDTQTYTVLTADSFLGPYTIEKSWFHPLGMNAGDFDLVVDADRRHGLLLLRAGAQRADLRRPHRRLHRRHRHLLPTHFPHPHPPFVREAPAHFVRNGRHYLITSGTTGYFPNPSEVAVADDLPRPVDRARRPAPGRPVRAPRSARRSAACSATRQATTSTSPWPTVGCPASPAEQSNVDRGVPDLFAGDRSTTSRRRRRRTFEDSDTSIADYVWLPLRFDGDMAVIDWHDEWRVEDFE